MTAICLHVHSLNFTPTMRLEMAAVIISRITLYIQIDTRVKQNTRKISALL